MKDTAALDGLEAHTRCLTLLADLRTVADVAPALIKTMPSAIPNIEKIITHLKQDPDKFRLIRPFIVVHAPSMQAAFWMFIKAETNKSLSDEILGELLPSFARAAQLIDQAAQRLDDAVVHDLRVELEVLADRAPAILIVHEPEKPSVFSKFMPKVLKDAADSTAEAVARTARVTKAVVIDNVVDATAWSLNAVYRIPSYGATWTKEGLQHLEASTLDPVAVRLKAAQHGLAAGVTSGATLGLIVAILCPPLMPLVALDAVASAIDGYDRGLKKAQVLKGAEREAAIQKLRDERSQILKDIAGGAEVWQVEAGPLNVIVDARTGEIERIVADGEFAGRRLEDLSKAERAKLLGQG